MNNPLTIAHLGCGPRGHEHIQAIVASASALRLTGLCDASPDRLRESAACVPDTVTRYSEAATMLREVRPDIFSFVTQPATRLSLVRLAVDHGVKAIVMEKPMALSLAEARETCALAKEAGVQIIVSHQHKYAGHWRSVKELIDCGELGDIRTLHLTSKGWMAYYATHLIDYGLWLAGSPEILWAVGHACRWHSDSSHPSPEYLWGQLALSNGTRLLIECGPDAPDQPNLRPEGGDWFNFWGNAGATVVGTKGEANVVVSVGWSAVTARSGAVGSSEVAFDGAKDTAGLYMELAETLNAGADTHSCRAEIALRGYEALVGICRSAVDRRVVALPLEADSDAIGQLQTILNSPSL